MRFYIVALIFILIASSCGTIDFSDQPQGIIEYDVTYLSNKSSMPTNLLPKKVVLKFRSSKSITTIEGFMGMFSLSNISDFRKHTNVSLLKVMDNKYFYHGEKNESPFFFDNLKDFDIAFGNDSKILAGLKCKKATLRFKDKNNSPFEVYYTEEIKLKNPNKSTPLNAINGVLMEFNINLNNIEMRLTASKYKNESIPSEIFDIPEKYREVSRQKMSNVITKLLE
jgi:GLPGLI family protein